jgi:hypothetical protein
VHPGTLAAGALPQYQYNTFVVGIKYVPKHTRKPNIPGVAEWPGILATDVIRPVVIDGAVNANRYMELLQGRKTLQTEQHYDLGSMV